MVSIVFELWHSVSKCSYGRRAFFSVAAPLLWKSLPQHIKDAGSLDIFRRQLKTVLFRRAYFN